MLRRTFVLAATAGMLSTAGCTDSAEEPGQSPGDSSTSPSTSPANAESGRRVIVDETLYSRTRYPVELARGDVLHFSIDVKKGTFCLVDVASEEAKENVFKKRVRTQSEFTYNVEYDGVHYVTFQGMDEADVKLWIE